MFNNMTDYDNWLDDLNNTFAYEYDPYDPDGDAQEPNDVRFPLAAAPIADTTDCPF